MRKVRRSIIHPGMRPAKFCALLCLAAQLCASVPSRAAGGGIPASQAAQQGSTIKGHVVDETGEPMIGVTVKVMNGKGGVITDISGNFTLDVPASAMIQLSYTGYKMRTVSVGGRSELIITMEPDAVGLEDVVVIGYGTVKKRDLTGAVSSVKKEDIVIAPTNDPMEALQGRVAGLDITKTSGQLGDDVSILLRGSRSIYGDNSPLFIIDGFIGNYNQVNPSDIESIEVLRDASSTAIYGSAGANGVIIITTKRGISDKVTVNFDAYYGFSGSPNYKHGMVGDEWLAYQQEAYKYVNGNYPANMDVLFGNQEYFDAYNAGKWIDWVDELTGNTATTQKYNVSVTGGSQRTKVFASASYTKETGLLSSEDRDRYAMRLNLDQQLFKWAKIGFSSHLTYTDQDKAYNKSYTGSLSAFPLGDIRNEEGVLNHEYIQNQYSPLSDFIENQYINNTRSTYVTANGYLEIVPIEGLSLKTQVSATLSNTRQGEYWGEYCNANRPTYAGTPWAEKNYSNNWSYTWENIISYNTTMAKDHSLGAQLISSWTKAQDETTTAGAGGQMVDSWSFHRLNSGTSQWVKSDFSQTQQMSYALRLNYAYKGKYLLTFSNRWDGVSWFIKGEKWDAFPAGALAWRISDEPFMKSTSGWLDNLKLRLSYGVTGNSGGIGAYATNAQAYLYSSAGITVDGTYVQFAQYTGTYGGSLTWDKSYNWNFGIDFGVLGGRIDGAIDLFSTHTKGLLYSRTLPITSGITGWGSPLSSWQNLAETSNKGFELTVNSRNIKTKAFQWNTNLTLTWSEEKIESLPEGDIISESLFVGSPIKSIYGYKYVGIWGTDASQEELDTYGVEAGFIKIETVESEGDEGKHKYSTDDRQILGHENPNWIIGLNNTFAYKGFDLSIYAMARLGQTIESDLMGWYTASSSITDNQVSGVDYWTETNQGAYYPRPGTGSKQSTVIGALNICDGSFIKIKNITLGYTLPDKITKKALIEKLRVYATCYNPFIFTMDKNLRKLDVDPETNGSDVFPTYKQFVFGVNITF